MSQRGPGPDERATGRQFELLEELTRVDNKLEALRREDFRHIQENILAGQDRILDNVLEELQEIETQQAAVVQTLAQLVNQVDGGGGGGGGAGRPGPILASDAEETQLSNGDSEFFRLDADAVADAEFVGWLVDDGSNGDPDAYDFRIDHWNSDDNDWMEWRSDTTVTTRAHGDTEVPERARLVVTKNSTGAATYRVYMFAKVTI